MLFRKFPIAFVAVMLAMSSLSVMAHMTMKEPVPFGSPTKDPLLEDGSNFPCKSGPYTFTTMNAWPVGSTQKLSFLGTAVHGGGSCQVSVTTDKEPTKNSKWKVVHSIEGGCPASVKGNLVEGGPDSATVFPFEVPSELPNGQLTMAWTWFNKIGNREFYMNCAPVTVSGGASDTSALDSLPDMVVANIGVESSCGKTEESFDYTFANPGKYKTSGGTGPFKPLCKDQAISSGSSSVQAPASAPAPAPVVPASPPVVSASPDSPPANTQTSTLSTIIVVTAPLVSLSASQLGTSTTASTSTALVPSSKTPQVPAAPAPAPGLAPSTGNSNSPSCTPDGAVLCSPDGTQFAICNFGAAVFRAVASGATCTNGVIARRSFKHRGRRSAV